MMVNKQILNHNYVNMAGVHDKGPAHDRVSANPEHCQTLIKQSENTQALTVQTWYLECWHSA